MALPDVKERLSRDGVDPAGSTPEALAAIVQKEKKVWTKVIREANIKVQ
jgi:tripartite-type tricarboxylate transporter receptor subunit TctC